jgi:microcompartment protein CcmK/EutM
MKIAVVTGDVVSTLKHPEFAGHKLLLVTDTDLDGALLGEAYIAIDTVDAGVGDKVLINKEGGAARMVLDNPRIPVQAVIVGVIDGWHTT